MPPLITYIARVSDGLPLVGSFAPSSETLEEQKAQALQIMRGLTSNGGYVPIFCIATCDHHKYCIEL